MASSAFCALFLANKRKIVNKTFYILLGIVVWYLFLQSGIHSTIAGVIVAFAIPSQPQLKIGKYIVLMLCVAGFIICGFEHCVADMFYFALSVF